MFGLKTSPDPHQEIVEKYLAENNPYEPSKPLLINLRKIHAICGETLYPGSFNNS